MLNRKDKAIIVLILLTAISFPFIVQSQTPPAPNTLEHDEGLNTPTLTADEYYLGAASPENITNRLVGNYSDTGLVTPWLELNGDNRTSWPSAVSGTIEELSFSYMAFTNASGIYIVDGNNGSIIGGSADADDVFNAIDGNQTSPGNILLKAGTYDLDSWTKNNEWKLIGEDGAVLNLIDTTSIVLNGKSTFENIKFTSIIDGQGHIEIKNDVRFERCIFDFDLDTEAETNIAVLVSNAASPNRIEIIDCELTGGESGAQYFGFLRFAANTDYLIVRGLLIRDIITNDATLGRSHLFKINNGVTLTNAEFKDIEILTVNIKVVFSFLHIVNNAKVEYLKISGYKQRDAVYADFESESDIMNCFEAITSATLEDVEVRGQSHPVIIASLLKIDRLRHIVTGKDPSFDLGSSDIETGMTATITNSYFKNTSLDMNSGWRTLKLIGCTLEDSRLNIIDEQAGATGKEKHVIVDSTGWNVTGNGNFSTCISVSYGQDVNLEYITVSDSTFGASGGNLAVFSASGAWNASYPTHIIFDRITVEPDLGSAWPKFITGTDRNSDDQKIWVFNSVINTLNPPLQDSGWNTIRVNDKFHNVKWINTVDSAVTYSESVFNVTISSGSSSATANHNMPGRSIYSNYQITPTSDLANCTQFWSAWTDLTATQLTVNLEGNCNDDVTFIVKTELNP